MTQSSVSYNPLFVFALSSWCIDADATSKPPLFVDEDEPWLPPSAGSPIVSSHPVLGTTSEGDGGSDRCHDGCGRGSCNFSGSNGGGDDAAAGKGSSACCDSHRLFGEALVVYLKSLSMAKEAIVWGHQALESLPAASSRHPPPPPPPPPSIPQSTPPPSSIPGPPSGSSLLWSPRGGPGRAVTTREDSVSGQSSQHAGQGLKGGLSRMDATPAGGVDSGSSPPGETPSSSSSEVQVAAWGTSLLAWLAGQFSTVLRRAERCRTELRGSAATSSGVSTAPGETAEREALSSSPSILSRSTDVAANVGGDVDSSVGVFADTDAVDGGTSSDNAASPPISDAANASLRAETIKDGVGTRAQPEAVLGTPEPGTVPAASYSAKEGGTRKSSGEHGAAPGAVAVSARDIVVRAALCQAQESAASEVLGMWEPARQGYEKVKGWCATEEFSYSFEAVCGEFGRVQFSQEVLVTWLCHLPDQGKFSCSAEALEVLWRFSWRKKSDRDYFVSYAFAEASYTDWGYCKYSCKLLLSLEDSIAHHQNRGALLSSSCSLPADRRFFSLFSSPHMFV